MSSAAPLLRLSSLTLDRGGRSVVREVSMQVEAGERVALVGPNAAGKSSLLAGIAGLLAPAAGRVELAGRDVTTLESRAIARDVALVAALQESSPRLTVRESAELGRYPHTGPFRGLSAEDRAFVERALEETELRALEGRLLSTLSAGERQRAIVARALAQDPRLLLLDEPSAHLDIGHGLDLFARLTSVAGRGVAVVAVVHDLVSAARFASRMVVLHEGRVVDDGPPAQVMPGAALGRAFGVRIRAALVAGQDAPTWRFDRP